MRRANSTGLLDAGKDTVGLCRPDQSGPLVIRDHGKRIYVARCAGAAKDRSRDTTDDHCRDAGSRQPLREVG